MFISQLKKIAKGLLPWQLGVVTAYSKRRDAFSIRLDMTSPPSHKTERRHVYGSV